MSDETEVIFDQAGGLGIITLNRPVALNALTLGMCHAIEAKLRGWREDAQVTAVLIRGAGRAFCAGGDIRALYDLGLARDEYPYRFYHDEYRLNALIKQFPKPYIALINGIVMGGGVGVSVHGAHRIVGENLRFAMPETGIGLFPDVGGSYFLSRCPGQLGVFLALTGTRIGVADALYCGIATAYAPAERFTDLQAALARNRPIVDVLNELTQVPPDAPTLAQNRARIDRFFAHDRVEDIIQALEQESDDWAAQTRAAILGKSPISTKVALRQLREGAKLDFISCMQMEYRLANRFIEGADFYEGVRATVIDKGQPPKWRPDTLAGVSGPDVDAYFAPLGPRELKLEK
ncbi:MAG: enoyl-CoA hydratase/isomerase family protein [Alphaproteobacteria bacterium]|nr:enoyl-CoA hydratase/isomerase family protein [Alphaproteobacteria bacterium]